MKTKILSVLILVLAFSSARADITTDPIEYGGGARPLGMGNAFTAVADDANALFVNPAGVAGFKSWAATATSIYLSSIDTYYTILGYGISEDYGKIGISYVGSQLTGAQVSSTETANYYDNVVFVTYAAPVSKFYPSFEGIDAGVNLKLFSRGFTEGQAGVASGINADLGLKYYYDKSLTFGLTKRNILPFGLGAITWTSGRKEDLPSDTDLGVAWRFFEEKALAAFDLDLPSYAAPITFSLGVEVKPVRFLSLRLGASEQQDSLSDAATTLNPSLGVGLDYMGFKIDYAYHPYYSGFADSVASFVSISYVEPKTRDYKITLGKDSLQQGDTQTVSVNAPASMKQIFATMPDGNDVELKYQAGTKNWTGAWVSPKNLWGANFSAKIKFLDEDYNKWESVSGRFEIK